MADDLVARLRAALDETERIARACEPGVDFHAGEDPSRPGTFDVEAYESGSLGNFVQVGQVDAPFVAHIARHDPASVLRMVTAHRKILDEVVDEASGLDISVDIDRRVGPRDTTTEPYLGDVLVRILAEAYGIEP